MARRALLHRVIPTGENRSFLSRGFCAPVRGVEGSACLLLLSCLPITGHWSLVATAFSPRSREHTSLWRGQQLAAWRCTRGCPILAGPLFCKARFLRPGWGCGSGSWVSLRPRRGTIHRARPSPSYVGLVLPRRAAFLLVYVVAGLPRCVRPGSPPGRPVLGFRPPPSFVIPSNERNLLFSCLLVADNC